MVLNVSFGSQRLLTGVMLCSATHNSQHASLEGAGARQCQRMKKKQVQVLMEYCVVEVTTNEDFQKCHQVKFGARQSAGGEFNA